MVMINQRYRQADDVQSQYRALHYSALHDKNANCSLMQQKLAKTLLS